ncbi:hypothetical protein CHS0354_024687 [Potamilus streckersoni]|uniref:Methyltransferase-like protein 9 n=1 Tax=Potamilus streckersoni TaxID=2493646 RepID=A0AAE0RXJ4_9BIVA|nr:hypothetical protein CHS0354_024687 [Potamilus streckersoni]
MMSMINLESLKAGITSLAFTLLICCQVATADVNMAYLGSYGRNSLARAMYQRMLVDSQHKMNNHRYWYSVDTSQFPVDICNKFVQCQQDNETTQFLNNCYEKADWLFTQIRDSFVKSILSWFMTSTSINGLLGRGSMFVFSKAQLQRLLNIDINWREESMLDLGAGDGMVTAQMAIHFRTVYATEASHPMLKRLQQKGYRILDLNEWDDGSRTFDLIGCLNLLDRCDKPVSILHSMKKALSQNGRVIVAVVLPFEPYVELSTDGHRPTEVIHLQGQTFEEQVVSLVKDVFEPAGFELEHFTRLPYLCEGDMYHSFYVLDDAVFVLKHKETS